ncbi:MAG: hypothetical protein F7C34_02030 [Desulfurococcales archaeon]|nr:hypothetical protein [Desulfurococcales archaeon]
MRYSRWGREIGEPASWVLGLAAITFALARPRNLLNPDFYKSPLMASIIIAFVAHELAHRQVSRAYGMRSEFVAYVPGLLLTLVSGFLPVVILAPGYVRTYVWGVGPKYRRAMLASVASGPATNIAIAIASAPLAYITRGPWLHGLMESLVWVNAWIAFFNLLPFPPLDGSKIVQLDRRLWIALFALSLVLLVIA